jgi:hypothetical protein
VWQLCSVIICLIGQLPQHSFQPFFD